MSQSSFLLNTFVEVTVYDSSSFWASDARKALEGVSSCAASMSSF